VLGWRITFGISSLPLLMIFAVWPRLPESDLWQEHRQAQRAGAARQPRAARPILAQLLASDLAGRFIRAFILTTLNMSAYWFAIIWLPLYLQEERGLSIFGSGWWTLIFVVGSLTGYLSFGQVSDRIGRRLAFTAYCLVKAAALALVAFLPAGPAAGSLGLVFMFVAGIGTGTWSCYGPYFSELFPTRVRGAALSVTMNVTRGVQFLTPLVIAAVAPRWGLAGGVGLAAAFAALAAAWIWTLPETAGRALDVEHHSHHARA
jgi:MFS family permease